MMPDTDTDYSAACAGLTEPNSTISDRARSSFVVGRSGLPAVQRRFKRGNEGGEGTAVEAEQ